MGTIYRHKFINFASQHVEYSWEIHWLHCTNIVVGVFFLWFFSFALEARYIAREAGCLYLQKDSNQSKGSLL